MTRPARFDDFLEPCGKSWPDPAAGIAEPIERLHGLQQIFPFPAVFERKLFCDDGEDGIAGVFILGMCPGDPVEQGGKSGGVAASGADV